MCIAVAGSIKKIDGNYATVEIKGIEIKINIDLIEEVQLGDSVLVHAGYAFKKIDKDYADELGNFYENALSEEN